MGRRGISAKVARRALTRASPLFLVLLSLTLLVPHVYAPFGDSQLGYIFPTAGGTDSGSMPNGGGTVWGIVMQNNKGDGFITGAYAKPDGAFSCDGAYLVTFPAGYVPVGAGSQIGIGQVMDVKQAITTSTPICGGSITESEWSFASIATVFVALNQFVGLLFHSSGSCIAAPSAGCNLRMGGTLPSGQSTPARIITCDTGTCNQPTVGGTVTSSDTFGFSGTAIGGLDLTFSSSGGTTQSQCLGNCNPTLQTNSTSGINFNVSQTIFYAQQATHDGIVTNVTATVGKNYTAIPSYGMTLYLGLYSATCQSPLDTPFTGNCPGFLVQFHAFPNPARGVAVFSLNYHVNFNTYIGVGFSASRNGLVLNDTTATAPGFSINGIFPTTIQSPSSLGPIHVRATATLVFGPGSNLPNGGGCSNQVTCGLNSFVDALGGGLIGGLLAWLILFGFSVFGIVMVTKTKQKNGDGSESVSYHFPQGLFVIIAMILMFILSAAGALPVWVPIVIVLAVVWLFTTEVLWNRRHSGGSAGGM